MSFARRSRVGNAISTCMAKARVATHSTIACTAYYVYFSFKHCVVHKP